MTTDVDWNKLVRDTTDANPYYLNADDSLRIGQIINRARAQLEQYKRLTNRNDLQDADWVQLSMDIINVHRTRKLKLLQWLMSDEQSFLQDLAMIHKNMDRTCARLPDGVRLHYAESNPGVILG
jgi:hypothetical protein